MQKANPFKWTSLLTVSLLALTLSACGNQTKNEAPGPASSSSGKASLTDDATSRLTSSKQVSRHSTHRSDDQHRDTHKHVDEKTHSNSDLADLVYHSGEASYRNVNGGKSTLNPKSFQYVHVNYAKLDHLNRTSGGNIGYLTSVNVANDSLRTTQYVKPTGWHQKFINNEAIINRGHEIAYSLSKGIDVDGKYNPKGQSGDQNNLKNLFTQTAFSNQRVQTIFESKVRNALRAGKKVVYQVKPIFKGSELMARGVQIQAISTDRILDFNVYLFNVQPGVKFDYATGRSTVDKTMQVPTPAGAPTFHDDSEHRYTTYHRHYTGYHRHHWVRDYLIYRGIRHVWHHHEYRTHWYHHRF